jgi:hypothetical protein
LLFVWRNVASQICSISQYGKETLYTRWLRFEHKIKKYVYW